MIAFGPLWGAQDVKIGCRFGSKYGPISLGRAFEALHPKCLVTNEESHYMMTAFFLSWRVWSEFCLLSELLGVLKMSRLSADLGLEVGQLVWGELLRLFIGSVQ